MDMRLWSKIVADEEENDQPDHTVRGFESSNPKSQEDKTQPTSAKSTRAQTSCMKDW